MDPGSTSRTEDRFATVNGVRLHYREAAGMGSSLLCLHGIGSNARAWDGLAAELSPEHRVIAPDLRGRGDSDKPAGPYGQEAHVADAIALLDHLRIGRVVVLGWSLGPRSESGSPRTTRTACRSWCWSTAGSRPHRSGASCCSRS
jgi:pimeloyl-ACP methyl ester carboxylesterase